MKKHILIAIAFSFAAAGFLYIFWPETKEDCYRKAASIAKTNAAFFALENLCDEKHARVLTDAEVFGWTAAGTAPAGKTVKEFTGELDPVPQR